jgi:hypothetical protein
MPGAESEMSTFSKNDIDFNTKLPDIGRAVGNLNGSELR